MRHQLDVCTLVRRGRKPVGFGVGPCFVPYPSAFPKAFASSNLSAPPLHRRALRFACLELLQAKDGVTTFHTVDPMDDLGAPFTPGVRWFRTGSWQTCIPTPCRKHWEAALDLSILVGPRSLTALTDIHLLSPYHPTLALNRGGFPEGFSCHHSNPIRYIVRRASHPVISETVAGLRRIQQELNLNI